MAIDAAERNVNTFSENDDLEISNIAKILSRL
jgi:hypothetical protein